MRKIDINNGSRYAWIITLILSIFIGGCSDIFITDISEEEVHVLSPGDSLQTTSSSIFFWWEGVEGAEGYTIQLVTPSFDSVRRLIIDSTYTLNKFTYSLYPGRYQWRIQAVNDAGAADWQYFSFAIDSTSDISNEIILLFEPAENDTTNRIAQTFKWSDLYNADHYEFVLSRNGESLEFLETELDFADFSLDYGEGAYQWKLRGVNQTTATQWYSRQLYLDTLAPEIPFIQSPAFSDTVDNRTVNLQWSHPDNSGSSIRDSVFVFSDEANTQVVYCDFVRGITLSIELEDGKYFWKVKSIDAAGNESSFTDISEFWVEHEE